MDQVPDVSFMRVYMSTLLVTNKITPENRCLEDEFSFWGRLIWPMFRAKLAVSFGEGIPYILPDPPPRPVNRGLTTDPATQSPCARSATSWWIASRRRGMVA